MTLKITEAIIKCYKRKRRCSECYSRGRIQLGLEEQGGFQRIKTRVENVPLT